MQILGVIPARYGSSRFPGKPLTVIRGKTMIRRVWEQASAAKSLHRVIVATDDERIAGEIRNAGGEVVMTSPEHVSGTERCYEAAQNFSADFDVVLNIQGDEPYLVPDQVEELCSLFENQEVRIGTLIKPFENQEDVFNPNKVKVVLDKFNKAMYFSRAPIPFITNPKESDSQLHYKHVGIYGFRMDTLSEIVKLEQAWPETAESLEQLRWLFNGYPVHCKETRFNSWSIDTPDDIRSLPEKAD